MTWLDNFTKEAGNFTSVFINGMEDQLNNLRHLSKADILYGKSLLSIKNELGQYLQNINDAISHFIVYLPSEEEGSLEKDFCESFYKVVSDSRCVLSDSLWLLNYYTVPNVNLKSSIDSHKIAEQNQRCSIKRIWDLLEGIDTKWMNSNRDYLFCLLCDQINPSSFYVNIGSFIEYKRHSINTSKDSPKKKVIKRIGSNLEVEKQIINAAWIKSVAALADNNHNDSTYVLLSKKSHILTRVMLYGMELPKMVNKKETISFFMLSGEVIVNYVDTNKDTKSISLSYDGPNIGFIVPEKTPYWIFCKSSKAVFLELMNEKY